MRFRRGPLRTIALQYINAWHGHSIPQSLHGSCGEFSLTSSSSIPKQCFISLYAHAASPFNPSSVQALCLLNITCPSSSTSHLCTLRCLKYKNIMPRLRTSYSFIVYLKNGPWATFCVFCFTLVTTLHLFSTTLHVESF